MQPTTASLHPDAWHAAEDAQERAWLDDWMRGRICPITLEPRTGHTPEGRPALTARSHP
jgi:hypothetical protein